MISQAAIGAASRHLATRYRPSPSWRATSSWVGGRRGYPASRSIVSATDQRVVSSSILSRHSPSTENPFYQQVRWKRKDGNRYHMQERAPTKKQRKRHNRQLKESRHNVDKHGEPGSKAGERREWVKQWKEDMLHPVQELPLEELEKYTIDDALLDDLMGNTKDAQPTPEPKYLGHLQHKFFNRIADQMDDHRRKTELLATGDTPMSEETSVELLDLQDAELPTDRDLSLALRAFRDREGTRKKPVGIVKALKHLLQDAGVPVTAFGELAYTSLLTCAQSPVEGRRIIQMMKQRQHPVSDYSWSIMVDIHAKVGDYKGCLDVHKEMIAEGLRPTMASFTSLLAACYKVCSDGRISHKMRSDAANVAWDQWQEMRVVGVSPDVMAYGAILRIMAARGKPERALNLLEELQMNSIAPTTLCFTSALRAVARSHSTAIRYEHGSTRRNSRREFITAHHGKLAQSIVRLAESAEVEQDDGFIAALISCASAAGDLATAKAIYVGHQVRQLDSFRTIGSNEHLARLRGESTDELEQLEGSPDLISDGSSQPVKTGQNSAVTKRLASEKREKTMSFGEREYGKDSRILSAIMQACANAAGKNMIGTQWQGRENEGYLCENSIRLLNTRGIPEYTDVSIPGAGRTDSLTWAGDEKDIDRRGDKRMSGKFTGVYEDDSVPSTLDELDDMFSRYFVDEDGRRKPEFQQTTPRDIWNKRYGLQSGINDGYGAPLLEKGTPELQALPDSTPQQVAPMHFNKDTMRWEAGPAEVPERAQSAVRYPPSKIHETPSSGNGDTNEELYFDDNTMRWKTRPTIHRVELIDHVAPGPLEHHSRQERNDIPEELFFDKDEMRWRTMTFTEVEDMKRTDFEKKLLSEGRNDVQMDTYEDEFAKFLNELTLEVQASGVDASDIDQEEARELFDGMQEDIRSGQGVFDAEQDGSAFSLDMDDTTEGLVGMRSAMDSTTTNGPMMQSTTGQSTGVLEFDEFANTDEFQNFSEQSLEQLVNEANADSGLQGTAPLFEESVEVMDDDDDMDVELEELRTLLPAFSENRLRKVQKAFQKSLGDPSLLDLVKISREIMPDYVSNSWLKQMSILTSRFVMKQAVRDGLLDVHMLNGVLQLETSLGRLDRALEFHQAEFAKHRIAPTAYSDRLVLQMFLQNKRLPRALTFKNTIEESGRTVDLQSYGSLIDYCARRRQTGSAMLLLQECLTKHDGAHPGNAHLAQLRIAHRQAQDLNDKDLEALIGPDPIRWLKHGEAHLKREVSKTGRRNVRLAQNALLKI